MFKYIDSLLLDIGNAFVHLWEECKYDLPNPWDWTGVVIVWVLIAVFISYAVGFFL